MPLIENNEYKLKIVIKNKEYSFNFTTELNPFYASVKLVRYSVIKDLIEGIDDKDIMFQIYDNSVLAEEIAESRNNSFDTEEPPFYVRKYVSEKTKYDLLFRVYLSLINKASHNTQLADFRTESKRPNQLKDLLDMLKSSYLEWEEQLKGLNNRGSAKPLSATKAGNSQYPLSERRF